jgi:RHS repeat-associated protein
VSYQKLLHCQEAEPAAIHCIKELTTKKTILNVRSSFSFGSPMPGRGFDSSDYRFGFNGKELDNEIKGNGNSLDFGARIYDPRLGRWLSLDPLMAKYPGMSPYNYTANNPVLYIDQDGRDYGVYVNHETKTIIIKATYHTVKGDDATNANAGVKKWNDQNGKYQYVVGEGDKAVVYEIKFELTVKEYEDATKRDEAFKADISGEGNKFVTTPVNPNTWGIATSENGGGINSIEVESTDDARARFSPSHEMGHTLSLGHWSIGLMKSGNNRVAGEADNKITLGNVSKILNYSGVGSLVETDADKQKTPTNGSAKSTTYTIGTAPENFNSGKVQDKTP